MILPMLANATKRAGINRAKFVFRLGTGWRTRDNTSTCRTPLSGKKLNILFPDVISFIVVDLCYFMAETQIKQESSFQTILN